MENGESGFTELVGFTGLYNVSFRNGESGFTELAGFTGLYNVSFRNGESGFTELAELLLRREYSLQDYIMFLLEIEKHLADNNPANSVNPNSLTNK